jgi:hypothetical protein
MRDLSKSPVPLQTVQSVPPIDDGVSISSLTFVESYPMSLVLSLVELRSD